MLHIHILYGGSRMLLLGHCIRAFMITRSPMQLTREHGHIFGCTSLILVLWAFSRTHFPTFGYLDRQISYMMMVFGYLQRVVGLTYKRTLVFLMYVNGYDPEVVLLIIRQFWIPIKPRYSCP